MESKNPTLDGSANGGPKSPPMKKPTTARVPVAPPSKARSGSSAGETPGKPTSESQLRQIAERAHRIWEAEGKPEGKDLEHWLRAETETAPEPL